jgi:hypothetical protein
MSNGQMGTGIADIESYLLESYSNGFCVQTINCSFRLKVGHNNGQQIGGHLHGSGWVNIPNVSGSISTVRNNTI